MRNDPSRPIQGMSRRSMTSGVALLACSLAATEHALAGSPGLQYGDMTSFSLTGSSSQPGSMAAPPLNWTGNTAGSSWSDTATQANYALGAGFKLTTWAAAYNGGTYDTVGLKFAATLPATLSALGTFTINFTDNVTFGETLVNGNSLWTMDGNAISVGDYIAAGIHTFSVSMTVDNFGGLGPVNAWTYAEFYFHSSAGGAVPLPGAAGLAACGLLGLSRRRRR
jgi:hypothetical protein